MPIDLSFICDCGAVRARLKDASPRAGAHVRCYCKDCQAFQHALGRERDVLDDNGGTEIFQTSPARFSIENGVERLAALRLTETGLLRWYAACCRTPVANTMASGKLPFVGVVTHGLRERGDALGPVRNAAFQKDARGDVPHTLKGVTIGYVMKFAALLLTGLVTGKARRSPFFKDGEPITAPRVLSADERAALEAKLA